MMVEALSVEPIGYVESCYREKFGIPRQPGLVTEAEGKIRLLTAFSNAEAVRGLEGFSHIWVVFIFHGVPQGQWQPTVRPPRLGGNKRLGVFATRSTFRPNPIGLSVVKLNGIHQREGCLELSLSGLDLLHGTPVLDIKPYVPYADAVSGAAAGFTEPPLETKQVVFSEISEQVCQQKSQQIGANIQRLIRQILEQDPRPSYRADADKRVYGIKLYDFDVRWRVAGDVVEVLSITDV